MLQLTAVHGIASGTTVLTLKARLGIVRGCAVSHVCGVFIVTQACFVAPLLHLWGSAFSEWIR